MKIRAFAIVAALVTPVLAIADDTQPKDKEQKEKTMEPRDKSAGAPSDTGKTATGEKGAKLNEGDVKIISHLHKVNQTEINLAKMAQRSGTAQVKSYATTLEGDHQSMDKDLTAFAKNHQLSTIPAEKAQTDAERQDEKDMNQAMTKLRAMRGANFDKEYLNMMVSDHDREVAKVDSAIGTCNDSDLKSLLQTVKPVLQRHADQARDLQKSPQASAQNPNPPARP